MQFVENKKNAKQQCAVPGTTWHHSAQLQCEQIFTSFV